MPKNQLKTSKNSFQDETVVKEKKKKEPFISFTAFISFLKNEKTHRVSGVFLLMFSVILLFAFISYFFTWWADYDKVVSFDSSDFLRSDIVVNNWAGRLGALLSHIFIKSWFGISSFIFLFLFVVYGLKLLKANWLSVKLSTIYSLFFILWISVTLSFLFSSEKMLILGGVFGYELSRWLIAFMGMFGTAIFLMFTLITFLIIAFNYSFKIKWINKQKREFEDDETNENPSGNYYYDSEDNNQEDENLSEEELNASLNFEFKVKETPIENSTESFVFEKENPPVEKTRKGASKTEDIPFMVEDTDGFQEEQTQFIVSQVEEEIATENLQMEHIGIDSPFDPRLDLSSYKFPTLDLLEDYGDGVSKVQNEELINNKNRIVDTLKNYSIDIVQIKATIGPTVTLYEIVPAPGIRISKIKNLEDDIALSLSALGIRIIAPIPGKGTIGIEVPNQNPQIVSMRSMLASEKFTNTKYELPIAIGKTINNECFIADLAKMPHLLMAGATGQGKSVGLNAIIASLLYRKHPAEIKFVMVDPKKVELSLYTKIERHFLAKLPDSEEAIITDTRKVVRTLNSLCIEMDQRYDLLKDAQVKNIIEYNAKFKSRKLNPNDGHRYLPYIVLIVDEFADLIMTAGKEVELPIARLAQLARAIGIHLIIATQRPSVNIITGTIKANFPARIAFRVSSKIDSRTILDTNGADQLIGRGDLLLSTGNDLVRLQCAFIDTPEIEKVADFIGVQRGYPDAFHLPEYLDEESEPSKEFNPNERDELFEDAARIIVAHQHGSTSLLQRKLKLGYNRAGRIIDQLEAAGIVGSFEGSKAREVKIKDEISLEQYLNDYYENYNG